MVYNTFSSPKRSISAILRIRVGVGVSSVGKLSDIVGGVFDFLFLKKNMLIMNTIGGLKQGKPTPPLFPSRALIE